MPRRPTFTLAAMLVLALAGCQTTGTTTSTADSPYDVTPEPSLAAKVPALTRITPLHSYAVALRRRIDRTQARQACNWVSSEGFPPPQPQLVGYSNTAAFKGAGDHMPNAGNRDFRQGAFYASRAAANILGTPGTSTRTIFADALLANARARAGLDLTRFVDPALGRPVATPDAASAIEDSLAWALGYMMVGEDLPLSGAERAEVETWLASLLDTFIGGYKRWHTPSQLSELRSRWLVAHGEMVQAIFESDPVAFNRAVPAAVDYATYIRPDGSHRFGASRGYRAVFYQGVAITNTVETMLLLESQGLPGRMLMMPAILRMANFWADAYRDPTVIYPYARENVSVGRGSDWRRQERLQVLWAIDVIMALAPNDPVTVKLARIRPDHPHGTIYTPSFNMTCLAAGLD